MLSGGNPETWNGWVHGIAFLSIIAGCARAAALAARGDRGWLPIAVVSLAASALFVVFLLLPSGNASFLLAIVTLFAWIAAVPYAERRTAPKARCACVTVNVTL